MWGRERSPYSHPGCTSPQGCLSVSSACEGSRAEPLAPLISGMGGSHEQGWSSLPVSSCLSLVFSAAISMSPARNTFTWGGWVAGLVLQRLHPRAAQCSSETWLSPQGEDSIPNACRSPAISEGFLDVTSQCLVCAKEVLQPPGNPPAPEPAMPPGSTVLLKRILYGAQTCAPCSRGLPVSRFKPCMSLFLSLLIQKLSTSIFLWFLMLVTGCVQSPFPSR